MLEYDIKILKRNILRMMKEKGITQLFLASKINMQQGGVSAALDEEKSRCFTVTQLADIREILGCTMDELFFSEVQENKIKTLPEAINTLFKLDDYFDFAIGDCQHGKVTYYDELPVSEFNDLGFCVSDTIFNEILKEWHELKTLDIDKAHKSKIIKQWQKDIIEELKQQP